MSTVTGKLHKVNKVKLLSAVATIATVLVFAIIWEPLYETNDDSTIAQILSGTFSGVPDSHTVYPLYPYSFFVGLLYRLLPGIPWYGLCLYGLLVFSVYVLSYRSASVFIKTREKRFGFGAAVLFLTVIALNAERLIIVQYSYVAAVMVCAAAYQLLLPKENYRNGFFLYFLAICIRNEVALITLPFLIIGLFYKLLLAWPYTKKEKENTDRDKESVRKTLILSGAFILCILAVLVLNKQIYKGEDWEAYNLEHNARTVMYDYGGVSVDYESNQSWYQSLGISEEEYRLMDYCNYSLVDSWDGETMDAQARWIKSQWAYRNSVIYLKNRILAATDTLMPHSLTDYSVLFWLLSAALTAGILLRKRYADLLVPVGMFAAHMVCWTYLYWNVRMPERITDGLWLTELMTLLLLCILTALKERENGLFEAKTEKMKPIIGAVTLLGTALFSLALLVSSVSNLTDDTSGYRHYEKNVQLWEKLKEEAFGDSTIYILDTYSFCNYTTRVFREDSEASAVKLVLGGSWLDGSPVYRKKLRNLTGEETLQKALESGIRATFLVEPSLAFHVEDHYLEKMYPNMEIKLFELP